MKLCFFLLVFLPLEHTVHFEDFASMDDIVDKWQTSWFTQYRVLTGRGLKQTFRVIKRGYTLTTAIIVSITCCLLYTQIGVSLETSRDVYGLVSMLPLDKVRHLLRS